MWSTAILPLLFLVCWSTGALAQTLVPLEPKALCVWADRLPACRSFLLIEAHARYRVTGAAGGQSQFYLAGDLGWMRNLGESSAIGVSGFGGYDWDNEITRGGVKARYRRWLGAGQRVDFLAGGFLTSAAEGGVGVVAGVEYALADALLLTVELDYAPVERHLAYAWPCRAEDRSTCLRERATSPTVFVGFGVGRHLGAIAYAVAAVLGILASGMK